MVFKLKRTTKLKKLMDAYCAREGKAANLIRFSFDGTRIRPEDCPEDVVLHYNN